MRLKTTLLAAVATVGLAAAASAAPVTGQISLGGYAEAVGSTSMGAATGLDFANASGTTVSGTSGLLTSFGSGTGSFTALGACASTTTGCGTIQNIASFATEPATTSFLTLTTGTSTAVSFDLSSISSVTEVGSGNNGSVTFTALGTINFTGYSSTAGQFILTAQGNNIVSFSATTLAAASSVPEPASLALLGGSLAALGLVRRRKNG